MSANSAGTLYYTHNLNPRVAVAVARHLDAPVTFRRVDPMGADRAEIIELNPNSFAPVLVEDGREPLWETDAIAFRLSNNAGGSFWPVERHEEMLRWISWSAHHFTLAGSTFYFENIIVPQFMGRDPDTRLLESTGHDFRRFAGILDETLRDREWLVGDRLTYADFRVASALPFAERAQLPLDEFLNVKAWHDRLWAIDAWRAPFAGLA